MTDLLGSVKVGLGSVLLCLFASSCAAYSGVIRWCLNMYNWQGVKVEGESLPVVVWLQYCCWVVRFGWGGWMDGWMPSCVCVCDA